MRPIPVRQFASFASFVSFALLAALLTACGDNAAPLVPGDGATAGDAGAPPLDGHVSAEAASSSWNQPDPQGRTTEGDVSKAEPELLIVTSQALEAAWAPYAEHRTLGGVSTAVMTIEAIKATRPAASPAASLRLELVDRFARGRLKAVLLGGDAEVVPIRRVEGSVSTLLGSFSSNGPAELYFGDLDSNWDGALTLAQLRAPEIGVGRVPVKTAAEVAGYLAKIKTYELQPAARATYPLAVSDIATSIPILGDIDGAEGLEPTMAALWPAAFKAHSRKLYATQAAATKYSGELFSPQKALSAFNDGHLLMFHNGHGTYDAFTDALDTSWVNALQNALPSVFLTCACLAGNFADIADSSDFHDWKVQGASDASAGERFIVADHGGVAYVGNVAIGLGPVGGSQFLHGVFDGLFGKGKRRIGDAVNHAHATMRTFSLPMMGIPMPVDDNTERWTHLVVVLLGDPTLEVWTAEPAIAAIMAPASYGPGFQELRITVQAGGAPLAGATVTLVKSGDFVLRGSTNAAGAATFKFIPKGAAPIHVGVSGANLIGGRLEIQPKG